MIACGRRRDGVVCRLGTQRDAMLRRGVAPDVAAREVRSLGLAIRARLWAIVMLGGDAA
jgi:hypothetical protein